MYMYMGGGIRRTLGMGFRSEHVVFVAIFGGIVSSGDILTIRGHDQDAMQGLHIRVWNHMRLNANGVHAM